MYKNTQDPNATLTCPYDPIHRIKGSAWHTHIIKCKKVKWTNWNWKIIFVSIFFQVSRLIPKSLKILISVPSLVHTSYEKVKCIFIWKHVQEDIFWKILRVKMHWKARRQHQLELNFSSYYSGWKKSFWRL